MKYASDWQPLEMKLEARLKNLPLVVATSFGMTTAINEITQNGRTVAKEDQISARSIVMPNNVFGSYEALAARLSIAVVGGEIPIYVAPQTEIKATVKAFSEQTLSGPGGTVPTRRFEITLQNPGAPVDAVVVIDDKLRLVRFEIRPPAGVVAARASVATRADGAIRPAPTCRSRPTASTLAGTLTAPGSAAGFAIAVVLVGSPPADRESPSRGPGIRAAGEALAVPA